MNTNNLKINLLTVSAFCALALLNTHNAAAASNKKGLADLKPLKKEEIQWVTTKSGLKYFDEKVGTGKTANRNSLPTIKVLYVGKLTDGTQFDASTDPKSAFSFTLGVGRVIPGWEEGLDGMKEKGKRKLEIPANLAYGSRAVGTIPANSTLIFDVELLEVK